MTKPMVSVAVMMLHDEGKLFLSDPVGKYLPVPTNGQVATIKTDSSGAQRMETVLRQAAAGDHGAAAAHPRFQLWQQRDHGGTQVVAGLVVALVSDLYQAARFHRTVQQGAAARSTRHGLGLRSFSRCASD
jgi:CubicO group peptidase (beta-lactamase class C family)